MDIGKIASRYLFVDMAITLLQLDIQNIKNGPFKIKEPYIRFLEKVHTKAIGERRNLKQVMLKNKMKIVKSGSNDDFSHYKLYYNGKEDLMTFNNHIIKKNVKEILEELIEGI